MLWLPLRARARPARPSACFRIAAVEFAPIVGAMASPLSSSGARIAIAGAGIIGLSVAAELAGWGHSVTLFDPGTPGRGASWAAAGMLAPAFEAAGRDGHHPDLLAACFESKRLWPEWGRWLAADTPGGLRFVGTGSIALAAGDGDAAELDRMAAALAASGATVDRLSRADLLRWEPGLGEPVREGLALTSDGRVDNRAVVTALVDRLERNPSVRRVAEPAPLTLADGRIEAAGHDCVVIAAGWQSPGLRVRGDGRDIRLGDLLPELAAISPVKGQMLSVAGHVDLEPRHTLRHRGVYIVPRHDRVIIGATSERGVTDRRVEADALSGLKAAASRLLPSLAARETLESWSGIRPGTPDHAPLIGPASLPGVLLACGHHRNGILLSPLTARLIAACLKPGPLPALATVFSPARFAPAPV